MSATVPAILIVLTSHATLADGATPTGLWLEELATPYFVFKDAGATITLASPAGGAPPIDPRSEKTPTPSTERFLSDAEATEAFAHTKRLADLQKDIDAGVFDIIFFPGGHGTMFDLPTTPAVRAATEQLWRQGGVVAAVCHGPAALTNAYDDDGQPIIHGRTVAGFTNEEEEKAGLTSAVPFLLQSRLESQGARFTKGPAYKPHAARDGRLVTGQNPSSSKLVAEQALIAWRERAR